MIPSITLLLAELVALPWLLFILLPAWNMRGRNFKGDEIPVGFGIYIVFWSLSALFLLWRRLSIPPSSVTNWFILLATFGCLGFLDDIAGNRNSSGLKGHISALMRQGKITTGLIKAMGGVIAAFLLAYRLHTGSPVILILDGLIVALAANAINLLDLRPGRAGSVFFILSIPFWAPALLATRIPPFFLLIPPALLMQWYDSRGKLMMGDAGSNVMGAALGFDFITSHHSTLVLAIMLALLAGLHLLAEKVSFTKEIEKRDWLRKLDSLTGVR